MPTWGHARVWGTSYYDVFDPFWFKLGIDFSLLGLK